MSEQVTKEGKEWDMVIGSKSSLFDLKLRDVWRYRDLLVMFVKRDFISFYKQTVLGPFWFFIQPVFTTLVFVFIFGNIAGMGQDGLPSFLFYLSGITCWNYFAECLNKTSTTFTSNAGIFGKVYFPRLIMPLSIITSNLLRFGVQLLLLIVMMVFYYIRGDYFTITPAILLFPFLILLMALLGLGTGLIISAMTTKYRDLSFLIVFGVQLLMYGTTVAYPLNAPQLVNYRWIIELNPMTPIIEAFRYGFLGKGTFTAASLAYSTSISLVVLVIGVVIFNKTEKDFVDTV